MRRDPCKGRVLPWAARLPSTPHERYLLDYAMTLTRHELLEHLDEQIEFLKDSCQLYDGGRIREYKRLSLSIRIILHDTRHSRSLLSQLGVKDNLVYLNTAEPFFENTATEFRSNLGLVAMTMSPEGINYIPKLSSPFPESSSNPNTDFNSWWTERLMDGDQGHLLSRKFCVLNVADKDGDAHVDPQLPEDYLQLSKNDRYNIKVMWGTGEETYSSPIPATVRQVAHELVETIKANRNIIY